MRLLGITAPGPSPDNPPFRYAWDAGSLWQEAARGAAQHRGFRPDRRGREHHAHRGQARHRAAGFDAAHPATRKGGKPEIVRALKREFRPLRVVAVGDGVSDLETKDEVNLFVGFGRYAERAKVKAGAHAFIKSLSELIPLLKA